ncbi:MAG TPA: phosphoenolpyruvate synthase [Deltaproteobacteria bacterium]|nr:phosphoenolpyruvate synthase [Deltaproteobacteria bacterium]
MSSYIRWFEEIGIDDVAIVGGKNASLGEMIRALGPAGIRVPGGFAVTAAGYRRFIEAAQLGPRIADHLVRLRAGEIDLQAAGRAIRDAVSSAPWPDDLQREVTLAYASLCERLGEEDTAVAVRSSATAEDLPDASFAGQQETFLDVSGIESVLEHCRRCFASLHTDRAITYRHHHGYDAQDVALSVGIQRMVRSGEGSAGTMFTLDTETGFGGVVLIDSSWGLGESVVGGHVTPDEFRVFKPLLSDPQARPILERRLGTKESTLLRPKGAQRNVRVPTARADRDRLSISDDQVLQLARWAVQIEDHYGRPMDIEWALDGVSHELFITQARPETVHARSPAASLRSWILEEEGEILTEGVAVGHGIASGRARVLLDPTDADCFKDGDVLITTMTDPDWMPIMERASGIVTERGGRTSHAAIICRELGVPGIVGSGDATSVIHTGQPITVSCAQGDRGRVYAGALAFHCDDLDVGELPETKTQIMMIVGSPQTAFRWWRVPCEGIGLARMEFIINSVVRVHPLALLSDARIPDPTIRQRIAEVIRGYPDGETFFVERLASAMASIAAAQHPHPVVVRMSDFKSNEYAQLIGGELFEPIEHNPMIGFRGASRYYSERYRDGFALECRALRRAREVIGLRNIIPMIPFCRTPWEADRVLEVMAEHGLVRGREGLQIYVMIEVPSNVILAEQFAERFDGFSIGSNDLTQLTLGIDRDSAELQHLFDARDEAVSTLIRDVIAVANRTGTKIGLCGQAPSDHPEFARFLVACGIDSISVNPDSLVAVRRHVAAAEAAAEAEGSPSG